MTIIRYLTKLAYYIELVCPVNVHTNSMHIYYFYYNTSITTTTHNIHKRIEVFRGVWSGYKSKFFEMIILWVIICDNMLISVSLVIYTLIV